MKKWFIGKRFSAASQEIIQVATEIIEDYEAQGYKLSLRQLYYQLVSRNVVPNTEQSYKRVGDIIADARLAGLADWDMIEDRNRETITNTHWESPKGILEAAARQFAINKWDDQDNYVEVMVEKQALEGVLEPVCRRLDVPFTANKGYSSVTMMFEAGERIQQEFRKRMKVLGYLPKKYEEERTLEWLAHHVLKKRQIRNELVSAGAVDGTNAHLLSWAPGSTMPRMVVLYLGDHDPSGIDMTRDVRDRLAVFTDSIPLEVHRLALNMDQIRELQPPENPAKMSDSRAAAYVEKYGPSSWELDADTLYGPRPWLTW